MVSLSDQSCEACRIDAPRLSKEEVYDNLTKINNWSLIEKPMHQISKVYNFDDYQGAINFTNELTEIANKEDHHPQIILEWGKVTVLWWSHKIKGLHRNDFICAAKTDILYLDN